MSDPVQPDHYIHDYLKKAGVSDDLHQSLRFAFDKAGRGHCFTARAAAAAGTPVTHTFLKVAANLMAVKVELRDGRTKVSTSLPAELTYRFKGDQTQTMEDIAAVLAAAGQYVDQQMQIINKREENPAP